MIEKQIIKLMLNKDFYAEYKGQVSRNVFQGSFGSLFETIQKAHEKYDANISVDARHLGMRVSAHIYNDTDDVQQFIDVVKQHY